MSRHCSTAATKRKIEHMPNMTVMGNASTFERERIQTLLSNKKNATYSAWYNYHPSSKLCIQSHKRASATHIVQHNTHKDVQRNAKEVHYGASCLLRNVLRPHLHHWWPEYPHTGLKCAEASNQNTSRKRDTSTFHFGRCYQELFRHYFHRNKILEKEKHMGLLCRKKLEESEVTTYIG